MTALTLALAYASSAPSAGSTMVHAPLPAVVLVAGMLVLAGFAAGMTFEQRNLRVRERQLAQGRRLLASQARGLRQQLAELYRRADAANGSTSAARAGLDKIDESDATSGINWPAVAGGEK